MSDIQNQSVKRKGSVATEYERALNFVDDCRAGRKKVGRFNGSTMHGPDECFVYFAKCGDAVKIGITRGLPEKRIKGLQIGCPHKITLFGFVISNPGLESDLHLVLKDERIHGEWFRWTPFTERVVVGALRSEPF